MVDEPVLVDTGALIALYNAKDPGHGTCADVAKELPVGKAYTCWPVITEAAYLLSGYPEKRSALFDAVHAGEFQLLQLDENDLPPIAEVFSIYHDQHVDLADAALVHLGNREDISTVFATDLRHFRVYRLRNGRAFRVLPADSQTV
jgi:predicted nucleic acid-binding protein